MSEAVARLFLDKFGKGPLHVETYVNGDVAVTLMRDVFTPAERTMIADGKTGERAHHADAVAAGDRGHVQGAPSRDATGRRVLAVISGFELDRGDGHRGVRPGAALTQTAALGTRALRARVRRAPR